MSTSPAETSAGSALEKLISDLYAMYTTGDASVWVDHLSDDVIAVGSDPGEWWEGRARLQEVLSAQARELHEAGARLVGGDLRIVAHGDVAWAVDRWTLHLADGRDVPGRLTVLATVQDGRSVIRHFHFSVAVRNEDSVGRELTT